MRIAYIVCKNKEEAEKIASKLLDEKLIVCANMFPIDSIFRWKGKIEKSSEYVLIAKTIKEKYEEVKRLTKEMHSYETPAIFGFNVDADEDYLNWAKEEIK